MLNRDLLREIKRKHTDSSLIVSKNKISLEATSDKDSKDLYQEV